MFDFLKRRSSLVFIIVLIIIARFYNLSCDPPFDFPLGFIGDEGWWTHNARNHAIFSETVMNEFNQAYIISFPFYISQIIIFAISGVGFYQARLVSAISGLLTLIIFFFFIKREKGIETAGLTSLFFGLNYIFLAYCRVALVDTMQLLFLLVSLYLIRNQNDRYIKYSISGIFFGLALITKTTVIFALGTFGLFFLLQLLDDIKAFKKIVSRFAVFLSSLGIFLIFWYLFIVKPMGDEIEILYSRLAYDNFHGTLITAFKNIFTLFASISTDGISISQFITQMPIVQILCWLYLFNLLLDFYGNKDKNPLRRIKKVDLLFLSVIIFGFITLSPMTHKPLRRYIVFIPFICYFAATFLQNIKVIRLKEYFDIMKTKKFLSPVRMLMTLILCLPLLVLIIPSLSILAKKVCSMIPFKGLNVVHGDIHISNFQVLTFISIYILSHISFYILSRSKINFKTKLEIPREPAIVVFLVVTLILYGLHFYKPTFTLRDTSRMLGGIFSEKTLVIGGVADSLCLENRARTAHVWESPSGRVLNGSIVKRNEADYLLSIRKAGDILIPESELSSQLKLFPLKVLKLCPTRDRKNYRIEVEFSKIIK